jgi:hypothetical protein
MELLNFIAFLKEFSNVIFINGNKIKEIIIKENDLEISCVYLNGETEILFKNGNIFLPSEINLIFNNKNIFSNIIKLLPKNVIIMSNEQERKIIVDSNKFSLKQFSSVRVVKNDIKTLMKLELEKRKMILNQLIILNFVEENLQEKVFIPKIEKNSKISFSSDIDQYITKKSDNYNPELLTKLNSFKNSENLNRFISNFIEKNNLGLENLNRSIFHLKYSLMIQNNFKNLEISSIVDDINCNFKIHI